MRFIPDVETGRFDRFVRSHPTKSHFMQSPAWGRLCAAGKGQTPYYVGLEEENGELCAAALLLERRIPVLGSYFYCPRGFVCDFADEALLARFTAEVRAFLAGRGAMFLRIDPDCERRQLKNDGTPLESEAPGDVIIERLRALGFRHRGFNLGFEGRQPRFTFRIDLTPDEGEIKKRIVGNVMKNVRKGEQGYPCEIRRGGSGDIPTLYRLIKLTSERDRFFGYPESYYQQFYDLLSAEGMAELYIGRALPREILASLEGRLAELRRVMPSYKKEHHLREAALTEARLEREIEKYRPLAESFPDGADISAHLVVRYGSHSWAVHAGSDTAMNETFLNNRVYLYKLLDQKRLGSLWLDQFGTVGDPADSELRTLHEFKAQFGGRYIEFIGEFDLVLRPAPYFIYDRLIPLYRRARFSLKGFARRMSGRK